MESSKCIFPPNMHISNLRPTAPERSFLFGFSCRRSPCSGVFFWIPATSRDGAPVRFIYEGTWGYLRKFNLLRTRRFAAAGTRQAASGAFETRFAIPFAAGGAASPRPGRGDVVATACARLWRRRPSDDRRRTTFSKPTDALSNARARARAWGFRDLEQTSGPRAAASSWRGCARGTPSSMPAKGNCG